MVYNRQDNQADVYDKNGNLAKAVRVFNSIAASDWDNIAVTAPDDKTEVYAFKDGATVVQTITLVYTDSNKDLLSTVVRS